MFTKLEYISHMTLGYVQEMNSSVILKTLNVLSKEENHILLTLLRGEVMRSLIKDTTFDFYRCEVKRKWVDGLGHKSNFGLRQALLNIM